MLVVFTKYAVSTGIFELLADPPRSLGAEVC